MMLYSCWGPGGPQSPGQEALPRSDGFLLAAESRAFGTGKAHGSDTELLLLP